jgi:hypothetical protein
MSDKKTLKETAEECSISVTTAFYWRHKILDALQEVTDRVCLDGSLMFVQIMSRRLTVHNSDISARPPLSFVT